MDFQTQNIPLRVLYFILCLTVVVQLVCLWYEDLWIVLNLKHTDDIASATFVRVTCRDNMKQLDSIHRQHNLVFFNNLSLTWCLNSKGKFEVKTLNGQADLPVLQMQAEAIQKEFNNGIKEEDVPRLRMLQGGANLHVPDPGVCAILFQEVLSPFTLFQLQSCGLWFQQNYIVYSAALLAMAVLNVLHETYLIKAEQLKIKMMVENRSFVEAKRDSDWKVVDSDELVPGDIVKVTANAIIPADLILTSGKCIVNEALLTGESVPLTKVQIGSAPVKAHLNVVYQGCNILHATCADSNIQCEALVVKTNFTTLKGGLVRSILQTSETLSQFKKESMTWICILVLMSLVGFLAIFERLVSVDPDPLALLAKQGDLLTISVPPLLPLCLSISITQSVSRLSAGPFQMFCLKHQKIVTAGYTDCVVFDKTGTLTEDNLQIDLILRLRQGSLQQGSPAELEESDPLIRTMACCQSLVKLNGQIVGDPLEVELFKHSGFHISDECNKFYINQICRNDQMLSNLKIFEQESVLARMSVVTLESETNKLCKVFCKGSPESISKICNNIPNNFFEIVEKQSAEGQRIIATAYKECYESIADRASAESNLTFTGLILMNNLVKVDTPSAVATLNGAGIRVFMATGDHIKTAIKVGQQSNFQPKAKDVWEVEINEQDELMIVCNSQVIQYKELNDYYGDFNLNRPKKYLFRENTHAKFTMAMEGKTFQTLLHLQQEERISRQVFLNILKNCRVYARMTPENKKDLIVQLKTQFEIYTAMCGDGANDCAALNQADVGLSLSLAEASIAAPFTTRVFQISAMVALLCEGRAALVAGFQNIKQMAIQSFIQFFSTTVVQWFGSQLSDWQFLVSDLFTVLPLVVFMLLSKPQPELSVKRPGTKLFSPRVIISVVLQACIAAAFMLAAINWLIVQDFQVSFEKLQSTNEVNIPIDDDGTVEHIQATTSMENTCIQIVSCFQYLWTNLAFSFLYPFKERIYKNSLWLVWWFTLFGLFLDFLLDRNQDIYNLMLFLHFDTQFSLYLLALVIVNGLIIIITELYIVDVIVKLVKCK